MEEKLTKSKYRVAKYGEVFTPRWCVEMMCDQLEENSPGAFEPGKTFLEPSCGEGAFILEILRRKFKNCNKRVDYTIALQSVYGFELLADNVDATITNVKELCWQYFTPTKDDLRTIEEHIIQCDSLKVMKMLANYTAH